MFRRSICDGLSLAEALELIIDIQDWLVVSGYLGNG